MGLVAGLVGGFLGWALQEWRVDYSGIVQLRAQGDMKGADALAIDSYRAIALYVCGLIGLFLGSVDGVIESNSRKLWKGMLVGALGGIIMGSIGLHVGDAVFAVLGGTSDGVDPSLFAFARQVIARSFGWAGLGVGVGIGSSLWTRSPKRIMNGAIGGLIGGFIGGFAFDILGNATHPVQQTLGAAKVYDSGGPSRALGFTAIGAATGFFIGLVDELLKQSWVKVLAGKNEGKDFILSKPMNILGRDERIDVPLYGDTSVGAQHAAIRADGKRHVLLDAGTPAGTVVNGQQVTPGAELLLRDGDMIQIGTHRILFREKSTAAKFARDPVDMPTPKSAASHVPMPSHICSFCGSPKKPDGSCLCSVGGNLAGGPEMPRLGPGAVAPAYNNNSHQNTPNVNLGYSGAAFGSGGIAPQRGASDMPRLVGLDGTYTGQVFLLTNPNIVVGREPDRDLALTADAMISRTHARIANENGDFVVYDNNSANGTFVNGQKIAMQLLVIGDQVQFGASKFRFE